MMDRPNRASRPIMDRLLEFLGRCFNSAVNYTGIKSRWPHMLLAFCLAVLCWYTVSGRETVETWVEAPVQFSAIPDSLIVIDGSINKVAMHLRGPKGVLSRLEPTRLTYSIDARQFTSGQNAVVFSPDQISLPPKVQIMNITPARIELLLDMAVSKDAVPVALSLPLEIKNWDELPVRKIYPEQVSLSGPKGAMDKINIVKTRPVPYMPDENGFIETDVDLDLPPKVTAHPSSVSLSLQLPLKLKSSWITVPVTVQPSDGIQVELTQPEVKLLVKGPDYLLNNNDALEAKVHVTVEIPEAIKAGIRQLDYQVRLPESCTLVDSNPKQVKASITFD